MKRKSQKYSRSLLVATVDASMYLETTLNYDLQVFVENYQRAYTKEDTNASVFIGNLTVLYEQTCYKLLKCANL